jgi:transcriptional regulator with XRE-family HTH domain
VSSTIQEARQKAGLTCAEVGAAVGRTSTWISQMECGITHLQPEQERLILIAVGRLARFKQTVEEAKAKLVADLKLPPPPARSAGHAQ